MVIGVDSHVLSGMFQGSRTYLYNLYKAILQIDRLNDYIFIGHWNGSRPLGDDVQYLEFISHSRWKRLTYQTASLIRRNNVELYHSTYISPILLPCKSLLTVHDILFETHPQYFDINQRLRNKVLVRRSAKTASQIHTISSYCKESIAEIYNVASETIKIVPPGVDCDNYTPDGREASRSLIMRKYGVEDYILSVGRLEPRKNHVGLLHAYANAKEEVRDIPPLVIVGQKDFGYEVLFQTLHKLKLEKHVKFLHQIEDKLLPDIFRAASLFVYPSFAEGFGIPPLEAMASGIPVITSKTTSLPEVVGDAGTLINPSDNDELSHAILYLLSDSEKLKQMAIKGRERALNWSWQNAAESYCEAIGHI